MVTSQHYKLAARCITWCLVWMALVRSSAAATVNVWGELETGAFTFGDVEIFFQMYENSDTGAPTILFLHGASFTSDVWVKLGTLKLICERGFRAIAIDLPGYGRTPSLPYSDNNARAELVKAAFVQLGRNSTIRMLVSPSMSGRYAIPFIDRFGMMLDAWVAIAPVGVRTWGGPYEFIHNKVRLMALYGEHDAMLPDMANLAKVFGSATQEVITGAGHACYKDDPVQFHARLSRFVSAIVRRVQDEILAREAKAKRDQEKANGI